MYIDIGERKKKLEHLFMHSQMQHVPMPYPCPCHAERDMQVLSPRGPTRPYWGPIEPRPEGI